MTVSSTRCEYLVLEGEEEFERFDEGDQIDSAFLLE
jgi:hypothetical protein